MPQSVSLIVTTYNWPAALELVLLSIIKQKRLPDEVIIADDGSTDDTRQLIESYQNSFPIPLVHSWQEDNGFRLSRSRNLAITRSQSDYVIIVDGDMILHPYFVKDHLDFAKPNHFTQGRRVILTQSYSAQLFQSKSIRVNFFSSEVKNKLNALRVPVISPLISHFLSRDDHLKVRGCNMAAWRKDIININGFNQDFCGWGREDSDFVVRLLNAGIKRQDLRLKGIAYHLYHKEAEKEHIEENDKQLEFTIMNGTIKCDNGLSSLLSGDKDD